MGQTWHRNLPAQILMTSIRLFSTVLRAESGTRDGGGGGAERRAPVGAAASRAGRAGVAKYL